MLQKVVNCQRIFKTQFPKSKTIFCIVVRGGLVITMIVDYMYMPEELKDPFIYIMIYIFFLKPKWPNLAHNECTVFLFDYHDLLKS